jgi:heme oxygenase
MLPLKEAIEVKHREVEQIEFNQRMVQGELTQNEYVQYLFQLYGIFTAIERFPLPHVDLIRGTKILDDIQELNPGGKNQMYFMSSTFEYILYLHTLTQEEILPHIYLNYLALMFGGQMMKEKVMGMGRIYHFDNMPDVMVSIRNIQKDEWAIEANKALDYYIGTYNELQNLP